MITDADIRKLKDVFDTKQESKKRHKETLKRFDSLDNRLGSVEKKVNSLDNRLGSVEKKVDELTEFVVPSIGNILAWTDDIHRAIVGNPTKSSHRN